MKTDANRRGAEKKAEGHGYSSFNRFNTQKKAEDKPPKEDQREAERETKIERWHSFKTP
jgi:hypothetical protein